MRDKKIQKEKEIARIKYLSTKSIEDNEKDNTRKTVQQAKEELRINKERKFQRGLKIILRGFETIPTEKEYNMKNIKDTNGNIIKEKGENYRKMKVIFSSRCRGRATKLRREYTEEKRNITPISKEDLIEAIEKLKIDKAARNDKITYSIFR